MARTGTVIEALASAVQARLNCQQSNNREWEQKWSETISRIEHDCLPSGSGVDNGCHVDLSASTGQKIVITCGFHRAGCWLSFP